MMARGYAFKRELIEPFKPSLGSKSAVELFEEVLQEAGINSKEVFEPEEIKLILEKYRTKGTLVSIIASNLYTRLMFEGVIKP
jgi:hypothetical protein